MPEQTMEITKSNMTIKPWQLALRPKTLSAAIVPVFVATALVKHDREVVLWWVSICAALSAVFIQIATNFLNDAIDFEKGADDHRRIGPQRVTQGGLLSRKQVMRGGFVCLLIAALLGVPLVVQGGWPIVAVGLISLLMAYAYTGGPFPLAYKGLGDIFVIFFFGLVAVGGTYYLHTGHLSEGALIAGLQIGSLATVLIAINNFRDAPLDKLVDKKTLAVRFGFGFARAEIVTLSFIPFILGWYWHAHGASSASILPIMSFPIARRLILGIFKNDPSPIYNTFLAMAGLLLVAFGLLLSIGLWLR